MRDNKEMVEVLVFRDCMEVLYLVSAKFCFSP